MSSRQATRSTRRRFTPLFDDIIEGASLAEAAVFGAVWRLSRGGAGECWASCRTIAGLVGVSFSVCKRALDRLEHAGALIRVRHHAGLAVVRKPAPATVAAYARDPSAEPRVAGEGRQEQSDAPQSPGVASSPETRQARPNPSATPLPEADRPDAQACQDAAPTTEGTEIPCLSDDDPLLSARAHPALSGPGRDLGRTDVGQRDPRPIDPRCLNGTLMV